MKNVYRVFAALCVAQFLGLLGFVGTLGAGGALSQDRLGAAAAALRGDAPAASQPASQPAAPPAQDSPAAVQIAREEEAARARRTELDRRERELRDQWEIFREAQVGFLREREQFDKHKQEWTAALAKQAEERELSGYKKELEYLSSIKASLAKDLLRQKQDADVVQLLLQMETRTGRKIIESCKTSEERLWIGRVMEQLRQRNSSQAEALTAGRPS